MDDREGPHAGAGSKGLFRTDDELIQAVVRRLSRDPLIDARAIEVKVEDDAVILTGEAPGASDAAHAAMLAREVAGGREVRNLLTYHPGERRIDRAGRKPGDEDHWPTGFFAN